MAVNPKSLANLVPPLKPGEILNPKGKGAGTRERITRAFLLRLAEDFERYGIHAIARARRQDPLGYVKVAAALLPKEVTLLNPIEEMSDSELAAAIALLRSHIASGAAGTASDPAEGAAQTH